jgi:peptidoglycan/LPS O-acetylase OafA/YrhL
VPDAVAADVFMLQSVLWAPTLPNVVWSLAYEMVFYLLLTALFLGGAHRRSSRYALVFAVAALALGRVLRPGSLSFDLFTPVAMLCRRRKVPRALAWLGLVSCWPAAA